MARRLLVRGVDESTLLGGTLSWPGRSSTAVVSPVVTPLTVTIDTSFMMASGFDAAWRRRFMTNEMLPAAAVSTTRRPSAPNTKVPPTPLAPSICLRFG